MVGSNTRLEPSSMCGWHNTLNTVKWETTRPLHSGVGSSNTPSAQRCVNWVQWVATHALSTAVCEAGSNTCPQHSGVRSGQQRTSSALGEISVCSSSGCSCSVRWWPIHRGWRKPLPHPALAADRCVLLDTATTTPALALSSLALFHSSFARLLLVIFFAFCSQIFSDVFFPRFHSISLEGMIKSTFGRLFTPSQLLTDQPYAVSII